MSNLAINRLAGSPPPDYSALIRKYGKRFDPQDMGDLQPLPSGLLGPVRLVAEATGNGLSVHAESHRGLETPRRQRNEHPLAGVRRDRLGQRPANFADNFEDAFSREGSATVQANRGESTK